MNNEEKSRIVEEKKRRDAKKTAMSKTKDPLTSVTFQNLEDPPAPGKPSPPLEFSFMRPNGQRYVAAISREEEKPDTALRNGGQYKIPMSVVEHLNSLKVPEYENIKDPHTGAINTRVSGYRNRFACLPADMGGFTPIEEPKGPGRPPKAEAA